MPPRLGPYRLQRRLGGGATGSVYLAWDDRRGRAVALKLLALPPERADAEAVRRRLESEARAVGRLSHPAIAALIDAGVQDRWAWLAMELAPGHDLQRYCAAARLLPEPVVLRIGHHVALALAHAHAQGVVHRDLKPSNVVVHLPADIVKLVDFGVASFADAAATRTGVVLGTPAYLAPEQLAGATAAPATDLYALGALLYHLTTGCPPFEAASMGELLHDVAQRPAPALAEVAPQATPALAVLVAQMLRKRADERPAGAAAVAARLAAIAESAAARGAGSGPMSRGR